MKKAVVYVLTALVVTGSCLTPSVAYATSVGSENDQNTPTVVTETPKEGDEAKAEEPKTEEKTEEKTETQANEEKPEEKPTETPKPTEKPEKPTEKPEEEKKELEKLPLTQNLKAVGGYVASVNKNTSVSYFVKKDLVILGYNNFNDAEKDGFIYPEYLKDKYNTTFIWGGSDSKDKPEFKWNKLSDIYTLKDATEYVKANLKDLVVNAGNLATDKVAIVGSPSATPTSLLLFDGKTGDYVGSFVMNVDDTNSLYDKDICQLTGDIKPTISYNKDKTRATLSFDFSINYPESMGGAKFLHFDMYTADKSDYFFTSTDSVKYVKDAANKVSGTVKDVPVNKSGDLLLKVNTTQGSIEVPFHVDKLNEPKDEGATGEVVSPKVSFSELKKGVLSGTPVTLTMYSDIDAILMFNGEASTEAVKEKAFTVRQNGAYTYTARTKDGGETTGVFTVDCFVDDASATDFGTYNQGGTTFLPQTGGTSTLAVVLSGIFMMIGGIAIAKKDALMAMIRNHGRKVC